MKKKYISPKVDIINTRLESEMLAGSKGGGFNRLILLKPTMVI